MNWNEIAEKVARYVVKIETPSGQGTGFLWYRDESEGTAGIATAAHVVAHAEKWQQPIHILHYASSKSIFLKEGERAIAQSKTDKDSAAVFFPLTHLPNLEEPIKLRPIDRRLSIGA